MVESQNHYANWKKLDNKQLIQFSMRKKQPNQKVGRRPKQTILQRRHQFSSVQLLSSVWLFATPWTAAHQASLSITNSRSWLKLMSIESVMPSNYLILCCPLLILPSIFGSFPMCQFFTIGGQSIRDSASASVFPMNIQDWFPLQLIGLISWSPCSPRDSQESSPTQQFKSNNSLALSFLYPYIHTWLLEKP